jgi:hypothetical protein
MRIIELTAREMAKQPKRLNLCDGEFVERTTDLLLRQSFLNGLNDKRNPRRTRVVNLSTRVG